MVVRVVIVYFINIGVNFPNYDDFPDRESLNRNTYDDDFGQTCKEIKVFSVTNHFEPLTRTLFDSWKMATGSKDATECDAMLTGDDYGDMGSDDDAPLRLGAVGCTLMGPAIHCKNLVEGLSPSDRGGGGAVNEAVTKLRLMVGKKGVTNYEAIRAELYKCLSDKGYWEASPIVTAIFMELLETKMTVGELQVSIGYIDALYGRQEKFLTRHERMLLAVCGAGGHDPHEHWTPRWVSAVLSRQLKLMSDWAKTEQDSVAREIEEIVPKAWARMQLYPPEHYKRGIRPYQCARP